MSTPPPPPAPPPPPPPVPSPAPAPAAGGGSGSRTIIIILCVILGLFILVIGGCVASCVFIGKKAHDVAQHPQYSAIAMAAAMNPDVEVIEKNPRTGIIKVRTKSTGAVETIDTSKYSSDNVSKAMEDYTRQIQANMPQGQPVINRSSSSSSSVQVEPSSSSSSSSSQSETRVSPAQAAALATATQKLPTFVSVYPASTTLGCEQANMGGMTIGSYEFSTKDGPEKVGAFYEKKIKEAGLTVNANTAGTDENGPTLVIVSNDSTGRTLGVTASVEEGKTKAKISFLTK